MLAQVFEVGLGLLARRDVHQRQQDQTPVVAVAIQHRELHVDMDSVAGQGVVHHLALLNQLTVPQILQLLGKGLLHFAPEDAGNVVQQGLFARSAKHLQSLLIDVDHADFQHAARNELRVHFEEGFEIPYALGTHVVEQALDGAEIFHPEGNRRMLKKIPGIALAALQALRGLGLLRDVLQRDQHALPAVPIPRQDAAMHDDVQSPAIECVVHRLVVKPAGSRPELRQLDHHLLVHVVPENAIELTEQLGGRRGAEQFQRALVYAQRLQGRCALAHARRVRLEVRADVGHPLGAPGIKQVLERAVVLKPE